MCDDMESYRKKIDEISARFDDGDTFTVDEACWLLYAELFVPSDVF